MTTKKKPSAFPAKTANGIASGRVVHGLHAICVRYRGHNVTILAESQDAAVAAAAQFCGEDYGVLRHPASAWNRDLVVEVAVFQADSVTILADDDTPQPDAADPWDAL